MITIIAITLIGLVVGVVVNSVDHHRYQQRHIAQLQKEFSRINLDRENQDWLITDLKKDLELYKKREVALETQLENLLEENRELKCRLNPINTLSRESECVKLTLSSFVEHLRNLTTN